MHSPMYPVSHRPHKQEVPPLHAHPPSLPALPCLYVIATAENLPCLHTRFDPTRSLFAWPCGAWVPPVSPRQLLSRWPPHWQLQQLSGWIHHTYKRRNIHHGLHRCEGCMLELAFP